MKSYPVKKVDTRLYIKGLSGSLVFRALYGILAAFFGFSGIYILWGVFPAVLLVVPMFFTYLYRLHKIQAKYGPEGWDKKRTARKLPQFISCKRRIKCAHQTLQPLKP
ncbi:DUF4133 domain-containing protein [uncultured Sunxiuqinia sp.]|uniref:DUF4133 domain-containing protein n=1 Tax=uncultured Sunxiuqinia sp. TaxID=1573825 RepID=UPI00263A1F37|nr:DUF4133 domain-containing protein [uncultured Sunxiuqinia sp.]